MKLLLVSMTYDYGDENRGYSYEHNNIKTYLDVKHKECGFDEFVHYDFMAKKKTLGIGGMSADLLLYVKKEKPDVAIFILFDEFNDPKLETIKKITDMGVKTIHWGCDDDYRWESRTKNLTPCFWGMATTYWQIYRQMKELGINVHKTQWGCNPCIKYKDRCIEREGVVFFGQPHTNRIEMIDYLRKNNINVRVYGYGWSENSRFPDEKLNELIESAQIVINTSLNQKGMQIKGRHFEVPALRTLQLTDWYPSENLSTASLEAGETNALSEYFTENKDIVYWKSYGELSEKIKYYLKNYKEKKEIELTAQLNVYHNHTWFHRFAAIKEWCKQC